MLKKNYEAKVTLGGIITHGSLYTLTADIWTKKSMAAAFLRISCTFYNADASIAQHVVLNVHKIAHPHTRSMITEKIDSSLHYWNIPKNKILQMITDNGANMQKAVREIQNMTQTPNDDDDDQDQADDEFDAEDNSSDDEATDDANNDDFFTVVDDVNAAGIHNLPCLVHTLQLIVKDSLKVSEI